MKVLYDDLSTLFRRTKLVRIAVLFLFVVLLFFLWKMQIIEHRKYWARSESNRIRQIIIPAPRGLIKDRNGEILAENITSFRVS
ncbi:MAG: penicillin-binding protein 2, partial [Acidobacteria bacterium]|nr:penicillin-binding protein 2 [Acidobacteriota bacterium]